MPTTEPEANRRENSGTSRTSIGPDLLVMKFGGSVITEKASDALEVRENALRSLATELAASYLDEKFIGRNRLCLVHGAGSFGHKIVAEVGLADGLFGAPLSGSSDRLTAFCKTQMLQNRLNAVVCDILIEAGVPAFPFQASASAVMCMGRMLHGDAPFAPLGRLLLLGAVPVLFGVPAIDIVTGCSILSGDEIAPSVAMRYIPSNSILAADGAAGPPTSAGTGFTALRSHGGTEGLSTPWETYRPPDETTAFGNVKLVYLTDVDGILDPEGETVPYVDRKNYSEVRKLLMPRLDGASDVTGGMLRKVDELFQYRGLTCHIFNGTVKGRLGAFMEAVTKGVPASDGVGGTLIRT